MVCKGLNLCYRFVEKINPKARKNWCISLYFLIFLFGFLYGSSILSGVHLLIKCLIGAVAMGGLILFSMDRPVTRQKWNPILTLLWFALGCLQLLSGLLVSREYLPMACIWLVCFPLLFLVWSNRRDYEELLRQVAVGANGVLLLMLGMCFLFFPIDANAYGGVLQNTNGLGQWCTLGFPLLLFLCTRPCSKRTKILYWVQLSLMVLLVLLSRGRTALLALLGMGILFFLCRGSFSPLRLKDLLLKAVSILLTGVLACGIFSMGNQMIAPFFEKLELMPQEPLLPDGDPEILPAFPLLPALTPEATTPAGESTPSMLESLKIRLLGLDKASHSMNDYSSGRTGIWKAVLLKANLLGHPSSQHIVTDRNGDVGNNAHNTILQFVYDNGILSGLLFTVMMGVSGVLLLIHVIRLRKADNAELGFLLIHAGYGITAMLSSLNLPFLYMIAFVYYLSYVSILAPRGPSTADATTENTSPCSGGIQ